MYILEILYINKFCLSGRKMDKLLNKFKKIKDKVKSKGSNGYKSDDEDPYRKQLEEEVTKQKGLTRKQVSSPNTSASSDSSEQTTFENIPDNEGGAYQVLEVIQVKLPAGGKGYDLKIEYLDSASAKSSGGWGAIDSMLIDEEMLYLEDEEADRMYQELKQRSVRRRNMEEKENRLNIAMSNDDAEEQDVPEQQFKTDKSGMN
jgi:hypothetical protein